MYLPSIIALGGKRLNICAFDVFFVSAGKHAKGRRVQVTFTAEQWSLVEKFKGIMGRDDAEIVRNIVLSWLAEKSVISDAVKTGKQVADRV